MNKKEIIEDLGNMIADKTLAEEIESFLLNTLSQQRKEIIEGFDERFGNLACEQRFSKCNCTEAEHELRSAIPEIKDFLLKVLGSNNK